MKNIFKFLSIALVAGAMMVACDKTPEGETTDTTGNTPVNPQPTSSYKISFNGNTWEPGVVRVYNHTDEGYITITSIYDAEDASTVDAFTQQYAQYIQYGMVDPGQGAEKPYVSGFLESTVGEFTNESVGDYMKFYDATQIYELANDIILGEDTVSAGSYYRWNAIKSSFAENITAVDLNALTMSATWSEDCFDFEQAYVVNNGASYGNLVPLTGTLTNYKWTWYTASK